jgi:hypothetical protein
MARARKQRPERLMFNGLPGTVCRCGALPGALCSCTEEERRLPPQRVAERPKVATVESLAEEVALLKKRLVALERESVRRLDTFSPTSSCIGPSTRGADW